MARFEWGVAATASRWLELTERSVYATRVEFFEEGFGGVRSFVGETEVQQVRDATDLVALISEHLPLRPKGREHVGVCPFHDDHAPSLTVVTHKANAFYKCHACGAAGDVFNFVMDYHKMTFAEALRYLADRAGVTLRQRTEQRGTEDRPGVADIRRANALAESFFRDTLKQSPEGQAARAMIHQRDISDHMVQRFAMGAAPAGWDALRRFIQHKGESIEVFVAAGLLKPRSTGEGCYDTFRNRLIFPMCDELGRTVAFGGRCLDPNDEPKYLNSAESPVFRKSRTLYGLHLAKRSIIDAKQAIVTEGYTDAVACHQAGLCNVVATLGTALTREHAQILQRLSEVVVLVFDGDEAGQRAADRAVEVFFAEPLDVRICVLPDELDPADLLHDPEGLQRFQAALAASPHALDYKVQRFRDELRRAAGLGARHRCLERLMADLANLGFDAMQGVRKGPVFARLYELLGVPIEDLERALPRQRHRRNAPAVSEAQREPVSEADDSAASVAPDRLRAEREVLALLIYQPSLRTQLIASDEGGQLPVARRYQPHQFHDPAARRIAEVALPWLADGVDFTVQQLMTQLDDPALRSLAGELYLEGERRGTSEGQSPAEHLRDVCAALDRLLKRNEYQQALEAYRQAESPAARDEATLRDVIEQRRRQGYIPEAIPSRVRS